jgi:hypothetical protein
MIPVLIFHRSAERDDQNHRSLFEAESCYFGRDPSRRHPSDSRVMAHPREEAAAVNRPLLRHLRDVNAAAPASSHPVSVFHGDHGRAARVNIGELLVNVNEFLINSAQAVARRSGGR